MYICFSRVHGVRGKRRETKSRSEEKRNKTFGLFENDGQQRISKRELRKGTNLLQSSEHCCLTFTDFFAPTTTRFKRFVIIVRKLIIINFLNENVPEIPTGHILNREYIQRVTRRISDRVGRSRILPAQYYLHKDARAFDFRFLFYNI